MKNSYYIAVCVIFVAIIYGCINSDNLAHEKEMKQLEIEKLKLEIKLKQ